MGSFIGYKVTNADLFNSVDDVEFDLKCYERHFHGDVSIEINGEWKTITGDHGANDYADEYGFHSVASGRRGSTRSLSEPTWHFDREW